jgi:chemotaxis protein CheD
MKTTNVGLAEWRISRDPEEVLCTLGIGSSVAVFLYDPVAGVAGAVHAMLPSGRDGGAAPAKYAQTGIPLLLDEVLAAGGAKERLRVGLFGGATLLTQGHSVLLQIGNNNTKAALEALGRLELTPTISDVGGAKGRTIMMLVGTGQVTVKVLSQPDRVYAEFATGQEVAQ